jgi:hypothetical protein
MRPSPRTLGLVALLAAALAVPLLAGDDDAERRGTVRLVTSFEPPALHDGLSRAQAAEVDRAIAAYHRRAGRIATAKVDGLAAFPFFPQAGILGRDLFLNNFTDQNPAVGLVRDWDCSDYTYDGHQGHDSLIRSFREQEIGVPVFAVLPGTVIATHDGEPDHNVAWDPAKQANYAVVDHGGGLTTLYFHFKSGSVAVAPGQAVVPGTQLGSTGSSGLSDWPHLHLETRQDNHWLEPSAGPCRTGDTRWETQSPVARDPYIADAYLSRGSAGFHDADSFLRDEAPRAGSFVKGPQTIGARIDLRNVPPTPAYSVRVLDPKKREVVSAAGFFGNATMRHLFAVAFDFDLALDQLGTWRVIAEIEGMPRIEAPFLVVAKPSQARNRKPNRITATLTPKSPAAGRAMTCTVDTSLVAEDADYDVVGYRYEWRVNGKLARTVTSAALSDLLAADVAPLGAKVICKVTPTDLASSGPTATAVARD